MKALSDLSLDKPSFLVIAYMEQQPFYSFANGMKKEDQKSSGLTSAFLYPVAC